MLCLLQHWVWRSCYACVPSMSTCQFQGKRPGVRGLKLPGNVGRSQAPGSRETGVRLTPFGFSPAESTGGKQASPTTQCQLHNDVQPKPPTDSKPPGTLELTDVPVQRLARIDEPSNPNSLKTLSSIVSMGYEPCCHTPSMSTDLRSIIRAPCFLANSRNSFGVISFYLPKQRYGFLVSLPLNVASRLQVALGVCIQSSARWPFRLVPPCECECILPGVSRRSCRRQ